MAVGGKSKRLSRGEKRNFDSKLSAQAIEVPGGEASG